MTQTTTTTTKTSAPLSFTKMSGTGNDFLIIDAFTSPFIELDRPLLAKSLCHRSLGVGADGLIFIERPTKEGSHFKWDFYNADGSFAEMCGNAARCVARYVSEKKITGATAKFETGSGLVTTTLLDHGLVTVEMPLPKILQRSLEVPVGEHIKIQVDYLTAGVPHAVKINDDWEDEYLNDMGRYLRNHALFLKTNGANATFFEVTGPSSIQAVTYERGVEGVTMACGTGAVAAATVAVLNGMASPVKVQMPGGVLTVAIGPDLRSATLTGEARFICDGQIRAEALL